MGQSSQRCWDNVKRVTLHPVWRCPYTKLHHGGQLLHTGAQWVLLKLLYRTDNVCGDNSSASKSFIRRFVITVESGYHRFHI